MKNLLYIVLFLTATTLSAQGITFEKGSFASILEKAKKENRLVFLDAYTTWCGPCKLLEKNVFSKKEVGDFYNQNFINAHVDMEKGEGIELAKKYKIYAYPSLLFLNGDGEVVYKTAGYLDIKQFLELGKAALNPENKLETKMARFYNGESSPEFLMDLIKATYSSDFNFAKTVSERYFRNLKPEELSREDVGLLLYFTKSIEDANFGFFSQHKKALAAFIPENVLTDFEKQLRINSAVQRASLNNGNALDDALLTAELVKALGEKDGKMLSGRIRTEFYMQNQNFELYEKAALEYYEDTSAFSYEQLNDAAWNFFLFINSKSSLEKAAQWGLASVQKKEEAFNTDTLARVYYKAGDIENAKKWALRSIELAKANKAEYKSTEELLQKLK